MKKRTTAITLAILGALAMSSCAPEEPKTASTYTDIGQCISDGNDKGTCEKALASAKADAEKNAPKFASAAECSAQFSNCTQSASGGWFMPALMGYMVGNMMSNGSRGYAPAPVYYDRDRRATTVTPIAGGGYARNSAPQSYSSKVAARSAASSSRATTSSRGGFGGRSAGASS